MNLFVVEELNGECQ